MTTPTARRLTALLAAAALSSSMAAVTFADAGNPETIDAPQVSGQTVTLSGTWTWFSRQGEGCKVRWVGWAVDWGDPNAPGTQVGNTGWFVGTPDDNTVHTNGDCGTINADDFPVGTWGPISHEYSEPGDYDACVLIYDIHVNDLDLPSELTAGGSGNSSHNNDNSAETNGLTPTGGQGGPCIGVSIHVPEPSPTGEELPAHGTPPPTLPSTSTVEGPTNGGSGGGLGLILALLAAGTTFLVVLSPLPRRIRR